MRHQHVRGAQRPVFPPQTSRPRTHQSFGSNPRLLRLSAVGKGPKEVLLHDLSGHLTPYSEAWALQKQLVADLLAPGTAEHPAGHVLLLQHPPVFTLGSGSSLEHLRFDPAAPPHPLHRTERGGEVTYHGPGQLVAYPILNLRAFQPDLHWYLRNLEEVVIRALEEVSGLRGGREEGLTGVWVGGAKVAAIGVRATRWVTYHGLALNVCPDLAPFSLITPCGIPDRRVTSVKELMEGNSHAPGCVESAASSAQQEAGVAAHHNGALGQDGHEDGMLLREYASALECMFAEVFDVCMRRQLQRRL